MRLRPIVGQPGSSSIISRVKLGQTTVQLRKRAGFDDVGPWDLDLCNFDLIFIDGRGIMMDYLCAEFGDLSFSLVCFNMQKDGQTDRQPLNALLVWLW